jgi:YggT family protein
MFVLGNLVIALAKITALALTAMWWLLIIRAIISWVNPDPFNQIVQLLNQATEPVLAPIRRLLPMTMGIDLSVLVAILIIIFLQSFLIQTLIDIGYRLKM